MDGTRDGLPPTVAENARAVLRRSIAWLKRTDRFADDATSAVPSRGRKRTTPGALVVWTVRPDRVERDAVGVADARHDEPVLDVRRAAARRGWKVYRASASVGLLERTMPGVGGSSRIALWTVVPSTGLGEGHDEARRQRDVRAERLGRDSRCPSSRHGSGKGPGRLAPAAAQSGRGPRPGRSRCAGRRRTNGRRGETVRLFPSGAHERSTAVIRFDGQRRRDRRRVHRRAEPDRDGFAQAAIGGDRRLEGRLGQRHDRHGGGRDGRRRPPAARTPRPRRTARPKTKPTRRRGRTSQQGAEHGRGRTEGRPAARWRPDAIDAPARGLGTHRGRGLGRSGGERPR